MLSFISFLTVMDSRLEIDENEIFSGERNPFVYNRTYELTLGCNFQLQNYPFDYQNCYIDVSCFRILKKVLIISDNNIPPGMDLNKIKMIK